MSGRTRKRAKEEDASTNSKRIKEEENTTKDVKQELDTKLLKQIKKEDDNKDSYWEWEDDGHKWTKFDNSLNNDIADAFKNGVQKTKLLITDKKFEIIFDRMVQRNLTTCWERRIRANKNGEDGGLSGKYCYVNASGECTVYNDCVQRLIFAAKCYNMEQVIFVYKNQKFTINLKKMEQINNKTKEVFKIFVNQQSVPLSDVCNKSDIKENLSEDKSQSKVKKSQTISNELKSITFKGKCPVDSLCPLVETYHVYFEGKNIYDAMLNQTNLKNNNNKFFLLQILKSNTGNSFAVWFRWGRVGLPGQKNLIKCGTDLEEAKQLFCKKFLDKTKNEFADRETFVKVPGKYDLLKMDYTANVKDQVDAPQTDIKKSIPESTLHKKLQSLIELICDVKTMEDAMVEMKYDTKKAPLGKLTKEQIKAGYKALQKIDHCITNKITDDRLILACDAFYTRIPHSFGMQRPPVIKTKLELKLKIQLLEALGDIEIALKVINEKPNCLLNPIDQHYNALQCKLEPLCHSSNEFQMITKYTQNTHAKTHNQYKMEVTDVFVCNDEKQNTNFIDVGNRMLLWHGSRLTNWVGILSQGLRIAPPEAPVTGYMFGKGVYFADVSSKSANYCYPTRTKNVGFVLLCEVSLGKTRELLDADYNADKLPDGYHSTKGLGKVACSDKDYITLPDGLIVPVGVLSEVKNMKNSTLNYNEYVVYDTRQIKSRYLVQLKFIFD
ncbi:poly [ADP-ribose] polymerase 2 isoform X1 [Hydra vulgaris]|uniref:poly [ADP-ribose] polymerase 2 isoform X1 n=1 Tax=Hydra vulgaris TaxID=6087 RepID=UPI001F5F35E5|nr:poly [ADP-ribose] polymerase 2 [Hydra vulgaris]